MAYYEIIITIADKARDALIGRLSAMGCLGIIENDGHLIAYFPDTLGINNITSGIVAFKSILQESGFDSEFSFNYVFISERDWNETWKKKFQPLDVGQRISVIPPWETERSARINLIIDPGMAFGTGHHETTKTCLTLIEKTSKTGKRGRFLDVGAGTGILAIAASKFGFSHATGVDTDPLAVDAARRNILLNKLSNVEIRQGTILDVHGTYDMIAGNLMSEILINIAPEIAACLNEAGIVIASGMLAGQEDDVIRAMEKEGLRCDAKIEDGRWVSVLFR
ncbi:MAG: 50S ribosomal protein L11 methyltransferase [Dissulfurispiraceae bacterium]